MRVRLNAPEKCWQSGAENCCWSSRKKARASGPRGVWWKSAYQLERFQKLFYRAIRSPRHSFYLSPQRPESSVEDVISKHFPPHSSMNCPQNIVRGRYAGFHSWGTSVSVVPLGTQTSLFFPGFPPTNTRVLSEGAGSAGGPWPYHFV